MKITMSSPKAILVAFIKAPLLGEFCLDQASPARWLRTRSNPSLAEKPKVGELQMDWLRSEDLKEEKNVTASTSIIAVPPLWRRPRGRDGLAWGHEPITSTPCRLQCFESFGSRRGSRSRSESGRKVDIRKPQVKVGMGLRLSPLKS